MKTIATQRRHTPLCNYGYQQKLISSQGDFIVKVSRELLTNNPCILVSDSPWWPKRKYLLEPEEARKLAIQLIEIAKECESTQE